jgi:ribonucleoside-diphosphate reductase alpha chain
MAKEGSTVSGLMDSFATAISLALQHGVPLKVLCEKFAHTRFEPSGWTGNTEIGYAKSIMDYLFRWMQIRFLSGHQLDLFTGLAPHAEGSVPVEGTVNSPANTVIPNLTAAEAGYSADPSVSSGNSLLSSFREAGGSAVASSGSEDFYTTTPPQQGIAPESVTNNRQPATNNLSLEDRGIYHVADAMKSMYDMGDAPSCATCGAIMTRNGSCYRCMSCGSTSGCS